MARIRQFFLIQWLVVVLAVLALESAQAGGWAVVTLEELPAQVMAGQPFAVQFTVRQHGQRLMPGLSPTITAVRATTGSRVTAQAVETAQTGVYEASMALPAAGQWRWAIDAFTETYTMPPLTVMTGFAQATSPATAASTWPWVVGVTALIAAGGLTIVWGQQRRRIWLIGAAAALLVCLGAFGWQLSPPPALLAEGETQTALASKLVGKGETRTAIAPEQMGEALFVAKGCIQCHRNGNVTMTTNNIDFGPDLTNYNASPEFLRIWLANPASVKPKTEMPNLGLSEAEIETLIAFVIAQE